MVKFLFLRLGPAESGKEFLGWLFNGIVVIVAIPLVLGLILTIVAFFLPVFFSTPEHIESKGTFTVLTYSPGVLSDAGTFGLLIGLIPASLLAVFLILGIVVSLFRSITTWFVCHRADAVTIVDSYIISSLKPWRIMKQSRSRLKVSLRIIRRLMVLPLIIVLILGLVVATNCLDNLDSELPNWIQVVLGFSTLCGVIFGMLIICWVCDFWDEPTADLLEQMRNEQAHNIAHCIRILARFMKSDTLAHEHVHDLILSSTTRISVSLDTALEILQKARQFTKGTA